MDQGRRDAVHCLSFMSKSVNSNNTFEVISITVPKEQIVIIVNIIIAIIAIARTTVVQKEQKF